MSSFTKPLFHQPTKDDYLNAAKATANSLLANAKKTSDGYFWPETSLGKFSVYGGSAGIIYFLLQLYKTTKDAAYLDGAIEGARYMTLHWNDGKELEPYGNVEHSEWCFYNGATGVAAI